MMRTRKTSLVLTVVGMFLSLSAGVAPAQGQGSNETGRKTFTISGSVGVAGVVMQGLPASPVTNPAGTRTGPAGTYSVEVPQGWAGTVIPVKDGYAFDPPQRIYAPVERSHENENYLARLLTFTISGKTGVAGVAMKGLPGDPITDTNGSYSVTVDYGWTGRVVPVKEGHVFEPAQQIYQAVTRSYTDQDYKASVLTYTLSGHAGIAGVEMRGLPGHVVTDGDGNYRAEVPYGWSGTVTPTKPGCSFRPPWRRYTSVNVDVGGNRYEIVSLRAVTPSSSAGGSSEVLVIPTSEVDPTVVVEIKEDMQVMLEILREPLSESRMNIGGLIDYGDFFGGGQRCEGLYLEGYGVVFVMKVDFPLSLHSDEAPEEKVEQEIDPVWQRARQKLYSPGRGAGAAAAERMSLEQFEENLVKALRHAANLRHVGSEMTVTVTIVGQDEGRDSHYGYGSSRGAYGSVYGGGRRSVSQSARGGSSGPGGGSTYTRSEAYSGGAGASRTSTSGRRRNVKRDALGNVLSQAEPTSGAPSVLTIQTTRADVDAFATGEIDFEEFRSRVKILGY